MVANVLASDSTNSSSSIEEKEEKSRARCLGGSDFVRFRWMCACGSVGGIGVVSSQRSNGDSAVVDGCGCGPNTNSCK